MKIRDISIKWQLMTVCVFLIVVPVVLSGVLSYRSSEQEIYVSVERKLKEQTIMIRNTIETAMEITQDAVISELDAARNILRNYGSLTVDPSDLTDIQAVHRDSRISRTLTIPALTLQSFRLTYNQRYVDEIQRMVGGTVTIFQVIPEGALRIASTVTTPQGDRAVGSYIPYDAPVYQRVMAGERAFERREVNGRWHQIGYEPLTDVHGNIVAILAVGEEDASESIFKNLADIVVGKTGYVWIIHVDGYYVLSYQRERDGESLVDTADTDGRLFVQDWMKTAPTMKAGESVIDYYPWKNVDEQTARMKVAAYTYQPDLQWIIGASAYVEDFQDSLRNIRNITIGVSTAAILIGMVVAYVLALLIIRPLEQGVAFARAIADGDMNSRITIQQRDEIGVLADALRTMHQKIGRVLQEIQDLTRAIQAGKLETRGNAAAFAGGWRDVIEGTNGLIDAFVTPIHVTGEYLERMAQGEIPEPLADDYQGDFNEIKHSLNTLIASLEETARIAEEISSGNLEIKAEERSGSDRLMKALNRMIARLNDVLREMGGMIQAVQQGRLSVRGAEDAFDGGWQSLIVGLNSVMEAFMQPLRATASTIDRIARGDIPERITTAYQGDFNAIATNLNTLIDSTNEVTRLAQDMAEGNLAVEVRERSEHDQFMHALNTMIQRVKGVIANMQAAATSVAGSSRELSASAENMSQGTNQQAAAAEQVSSSMEEMTANIRQTADNALQTERIAMQSVDYAQEGGSVLAEAVVSMQQISKKIDVIGDIANQTRFLSLNATLEAARSHEYGKSFSVVASEIRQLSGVVQQAAEEIGEIATTSVSVSERAGEMLATLVPSIQKTSELVQEISAANSEQSSGTSQINTAIQQLDQVTQQNAATSEQLVAMAEELEAQARQLQQTAAFFRIGQDTAASPPPEGFQAKKTATAREAYQAARSDQPLEHGNNGGSGDLMIDMIAESDPGEARQRPAPKDAYDDEFERY